MDPETSAAVHIQTRCRGAAVRSLFAAVRIDFGAVCDRLSAGAPPALVARPRWASARHLCAPRFAPAPAPARAVPPIPAVVPPPPKPPSTPPRASPSSSAATPPPPTSREEVQRELDWARAALRSRLDYLSRHDR